MIRSLISKCPNKYLFMKATFKDSNLIQTQRLLRHSANIERSSKAESTEQEIMLTDSEQLALTKEIINKVNCQIQSYSHGRLFAVVYISGKQYRITTEDLIVIKTSVSPTIGDKIRLEKILAVGGSDFTLFGRPLLPKDLVYVEGTVVEKTLEATRVLFNYKKKTLNFRRRPFTILRINNIRLNHPVDDQPPVEGVEGRVF